MFNSDFFKIYILPGLTFQTIVIAGGYCTGQEIVQYFLTSGPVNGLYGLLMTACVWSVMSGLCFMLAKTYQAYDYKRFFKVLLGKGWFLFDIGYLYLILIVLSVVAASSASLLLTLLKVPYSMGLILTLSTILFLVLQGSKAIAKMFTFWSVLLYVVFAILMICCFQKSSIFTIFSIKLPQGVVWFQKSISYASYNIGVIPAILFTARAFKSKKQAFISGILTGPFAILPAMMLYFALLTSYPQVLDTLVPSTYLLEKINIPFLTFSFAVVLLGTLIQTGIGLVQSIEHRLELSRNKRIMVILLFLGGAFGLSQYGLVSLIVQGYGTLTWCMVGLFMVPLSTYGIFKLVNHKIKPKPHVS